MSFRRKSIFLKVLLGVVSVIFCFSLLLVLVFYKRRKFVIKSQDQRAFTYTEISKKDRMQNPNDNKINEKKRKKKKKDSIPKDSKEISEENSPKKILSDPFESFSEEIKKEIKSFRTRILGEINLEKLEKEERGLKTTKKQIEDKKKIVYDEQHLKQLEGQLDSLSSRLKIIEYRKSVLEEKK